MADDSILQQILLGDPFRLQLLEAQTSQAASRLVLNDNFRRIQQVTTELSLRPALLATLGDVTMPIAPRYGSSYLFTYDGSKYRLQESALSRYGLPKTIPENEVITVQAGYQYLLQGSLILNGAMVVEGELVII